MAPDIAGVSTQGIKFSPHVGFTSWKSTLEVLVDTEKTTNRPYTENGAA